MKKQYKPLDQELIKLTQDLIRIPSWIPDELEKRTTQNENKVVDYLEKWLKKNTKMEIERQPLDQGRFNLIAKKGKPDILLLAHTDTVTPSANSKYNQLKAEIHDNKIWGRGATDMKSGIATMIQALSLSPDCNNVWIMLYADEEYDFLGMKGLVKKYSKLKPKLIVSSDGSDLKIGHGCRGLIEIRARVTGETGHAARANGLNAINGATQSLASLSNLLKQYKHKKMGSTSMNTAYILGGSKEKNSLSTNNTLTTVGQQGNVIPDVCEFVIDIRPATPDLTPEIITKHLKTYLSKNGYKLEIINLRHNLGAWYTDTTQIKSVLKLAQEITNTSTPKIDNPSKGGYIDLQMLWNKLGRPPAVMFGGGDGSTAHAANEYIKIKDLIKTRDFFLNLLNSHTNNKLI
jgi:succinyl-diaminopimelate desuccinylase